MERNLSQLFKKEAQAEIPQGMCERIYARLEKTAAREERIQRNLWGVFSALSLCAFAASSWYAVSAYSASSFGSYFSLIFSDGASIAFLWKELVLSLAESLPILGTGIFLASVCAMLWSFRNFFKHSGSGSSLIANASASIA